MRTREELAWAAGFFEGEGAFIRTKVAAVVYQRDPEPLFRFQASVGFGTIDPPRAYRYAHPVWVWRVTSFEYVQALTAMLWDGLSTRRRAQAIASLSNGSRRGYRAGMNECIRGHPLDYLNVKTGSRGCKQCRNAASKLAHRLQREALIRG